MAVTLRSLEVAVPETVLIQSEVRDVFAAQPGISDLARRLIGAAFNSSGIDRRRSVVDEMSFSSRAESPLFFDPEAARILNPSTGTRNAVYVREAARLFVAAAGAALDACPDVEAGDVTHVITVSCTGFFSPGPDYRIVRDLGLDPSVQRYHLGFMGCYAAFPALRQAKTICDADPDAVVLVVSAELCSIHVRVSDDPDTILGSSLFSDGAAAALITGRDPSTGRGLRLDRFATVLTPVGEEAMAWNIGDHGFEMVLGTYVPKIIDEHIAGALDPLLAADDSLTGSGYRRIEHWAIHPGGRSILDKVERRLGLDEDQLVHSRSVLREFGNMSSATVLFVLKRILDKPGSGDGERICSMAFGPGLTVETGLLTTVGANP
ncbi:putative naringenin-chalcone synthase [Brevibacterium sanguinis]|uniref:Naringenin-chalcone synthase n=2 Tax=Brevibacterium TaxID=1696 RepID=A0ABX9GS00_9MICO|nr:MULTISPECIES: type III polyketide synthase [Brevibacterium]RBP64244.1 putative naringenin-chalcone synthase [Brevibacterium sanguinis]RBP71464.1 putative naringenin-chalcone synthase [Brevibacterium celere]